MPDPAIDIVRTEALGFKPTIDGLGAVVDAIGDAGLVLIGKPETYASGI